MFKQYSLKRRISKINRAKIKAVKIQNFELAYNYRDEEKALIQKLEELQNNHKKMSVRETILRLNLIVNKLRKQPVSFQKMADYLQLESEIQSYNFNVSKRTFQRDIKDIYSIYNIEIKYNKTRDVYEIIAQEQPEISERILEAFDTLNALNTSSRLTNHIYFEKRKPAGTENLYGLIHAIKNRLQIKFTYHKFWEEYPSRRTAEAYALKEFKNRWYVLVKDLKDKNIKSFALDRFSNLEITTHKFQFPVNFNVEEHYRYCFGIISPNEEKPQDIVLSFEPIQGKYIKTLPLHETQTIVRENKEEIVVQLHLCVTHDFIMELLSFGERLTVIAPDSLRQKIKDEHLKTYKKYNN